MLFRSLTVDPEKRYTIKEFLNHPWIKNTKEPTYAAFDAPPLATPATERKDGNMFSGEALKPFNRDLLESPGQRRMDFRSPGAVNLREVFDVGYAVHRQEEEAKRRKYGKVGGMALNDAVEEEDEDELSGQPAPKRQADVNSVEQGLRNATLSNARHPPPKAQDRKSVV